MRTTSTQRAVCVLLVAAMVGGMAVELADAGRRRRELRIEELVETVRGIEKKVNEATVTRDAVKERFNPAMAEYEKAHAEVKAIDAELDETRKQVGEYARKRVELVRHIQSQLDELPGMKEAIAAVRAATEKLNAVKTEIIKPLTETPKYQAVSKSLEDAAVRLRTMQQAGGEPQDLATMRLRVAEIEQELREMVTKALETSEAYKRAKAALDEAEAQLKAERDRHEAELDNHPERVALDNAVEDLRKKTAELQRKLIEAKRAEAKAKPKYAFYANQLAKAEKELNHQQTLLQQAEDLLRDARAGG